MLELALYWSKQLFVNGREIHKFKAKDSETAATSLCSVKINKCSSSCNNINDSFANLCVPDVIKNINVKVFNLTSRTNETSHIR